MAMSTTERTEVENRFLVIEEKLNEIQLAFNNVAPKAMMKAMVNVRQAEITDLQNRVTTLESKVAVLESA